MSLPIEVVEDAERARDAALIEAGARNERIRLLPLLKRCLKSLDTIAALGTIGGDGLYKTLRGVLRKELGKEE